jgi:hypothetical protein
MESGSIGAAGIIVYTYPPLRCLLLFYFLFSLRKCGRDFGRMSRVSRRQGFDNCGRCHASTRIVKRYGLRAGRISTYEGSFYNLALRSGHLTVANCGSCHGVHKILPSSNPAALTHPDMPRAYVRSMPSPCRKELLGWTGAPPHRRARR